MSNEPLWSHPVAYGDYPQVAIANGAVYGVLVSDGVCAIDLHGERRWLCKTKDISYGAAVTDDTVIFSNGKELVGLARSDGAVRWRTLVPPTVFQPPTIAAGFALVRSNRGELTAVDASTGEQRWSHKLAGNYFDCVRPIVVGAHVVVPHDKGLARLAIATGDVVGSVEHTGVNVLLDDGTALYSYRGNDVTIRVHDRESLAITKQFRLDDDHSFDTFSYNAVAVDGTIYSVAPSDKRLAAVDTRAASPVSRTVFPSSAGPPVACGNWILVTPAKELVAIDRATHTVAWRLPCPVSGFVGAPALGGDVAVVPSEGRATAVRLPR